MTSVQPESGAYFQVRLMLRFGGDEMAAHSLLKIELCSSNEFVFCLLDKDK